MNLGSIKKLLGLRTAPGAGAGSSADSGDRSTSSASFQAQVLELWRQHSREAGLNRSTYTLVRDFYKFHLADAHSVTTPGAWSVMDYIALSEALRLHLEKAKIHETSGIMAFHRLNLRDVTLSVSVRQLDDIAVHLKSRTPSKPTKRSKPTPGKKTSASSMPKLQQFFLDLIDRGTRDGWHLYECKVKAGIKDGVVVVSLHHPHDIGPVPTAQIGRFRYSRHEPKAFVSPFHPRETTAVNYRYLSEGLVKCFAVAKDCSTVVISCYCPAKTETGHETTICFLSLRADRTTFQSLRPEGLDGIRFLKYFELRDGFVLRKEKTDRDGDVTEVGYMRAVQPYESDRASEAATEGSTENLTPEEFEKLVGRLLSQWGYNVEFTERTGDGGIDVIASNPEPIVGGTILVQCKYYSAGNTVGVSVIRDLYGALHDRRANKGIAITTSSFSSAALKFAEGKPIELIDGRRLQELLAYVAKRGKSKQRSDSERR